MRRCENRERINLKCAKVVFSCETVAKPYDFHLEGRNEAEILRDLYHPCIINIFDVFDEPRRLHIFEELCFGGTLSDALHHAPFAEV